MRSARDRDAQCLRRSRPGAYQVRHASTSLGSERIFSILLPSGYAESDTRYPVVYLFHGGGQDHTAFMARAMFPALARKQDAIFVMPAADRNYSAMSADGQTRYNAYVASELVDYVDANYRTIRCAAIARDCRDLNGRTDRDDDGAAAPAALWSGRGVQRGAADGHE